MNLRQKQFLSMCQIVDRLVACSKHSVNRNILQIMCDTGIGCVHPGKAGKVQDLNTSPFSASSIIRTGEHTDWVCPLEIAVESFPLMIARRNSVLSEFNQKDGSVRFVNSNRADLTILAYIAEIFTEVTGHPLCINPATYNSIKPIVSNRIKKTIYLRLSKGDLVSQSADTPRSHWAHIHQNEFIRAYVRRSDKLLISEFINFQMMLETDYANPGVNRLVDVLLKIDSAVYTDFANAVQDALVTGSANCESIGFEYMIKAHREAYAKYYSGDRLQYSITNPALQEYLLGCLANDVVVDTVE